MSDITDAVHKKSALPESLDALQHLPSGNWRTVLIILIVSGLGWLIYATTITPPADFPTAELVEVAEGASLPVLAADLKEKNVVRSATMLRLVVTVLGRDTGVRAGDYLFKEPRTVFEVARAITTGAFGLEPERITIPEGSTVSDMAKILSSRLKRVDETEFVREALPFEGFLFPDTYFFLPNVTTESVITTLRATFDEKIAEIAEDMAESGHSIEDIVIMASLLEKEANNYRDQRMIAGVLWNRLEDDMLLQVDATFLYTIGKGTFELTRADLASDSPYNTYKYKGLPPTAIGNPGLNAIKAVLNPVEHDYYFYLADSDGVTHYSVTHDEHVRKKQIYFGT